MVLPFGGGRGSSTARMPGGHPGFDGVRVACQRDGTTVSSATGMGPLALPVLDHPAPQRWVWGALIFPVVLSAWGVGVSFREVGVVEVREGAAGLVVRGRAAHGR
jgi:hypothetical protein